MSEKQETLDDQALRTKLAQYGFSDKEIETYLAVIEGGAERASRIAERADVSESYVYSIFDRLAENGFVVVEDHRNPTIVRPRPPAEAFESLYDDLSAIESTIEDRYEDSADQESNFELVNSRATVTKRLAALIDSAQEEVLLQLPVEALSAVRGPLERAIERDVIVLLILSGDDDQVLSADIADIATVVRSGVGWTPTLLAVDQNAGLVASNLLLQWEHGDEKGIAFEEDHITPVLVGAFLSTYWPMAEAVAVRQPPRLPKRYSRVRPAVYDATASLQAGRAVAARIEARPSLSDEEFELVTGAVVDVRQPVLEPRNADFGLESSLIVDTGDEVVSVGGMGCFREDYEATTVTLEEGW